jgi:hypothetical protein
MTGTDLCEIKPQSVPVIFEPPRIYKSQQCHLVYCEVGDSDKFALINTVFLAPPSMPLNLGPL